MLNMHHVKLILWLEYNQNDCLPCSNLLLWMYVFQYIMYWTQRYSCISYYCYIGHGPTCMHAYPTLYVCVCAHTCPHATWVASSGRCCELPLRSSWFTVNHNYSGACSECALYSLYFPFYTATIHLYTELHHLSLPLPVRSWCQLVSQ